MLRPADIAQFMRPRQRNPRSPIIKVMMESMCYPDHLFRVRMSSEMGPLMEAYCQRVGAQPLSTRFLLDGVRIYANDTPQKLEMEDDAVIEVYQEQI